MWEICTSLFLCDRENSELYNKSIVKEAVNSEI